MAEVKDTDTLCCRCLLGHGPSDYDSDRPGGHEKAARLIWHGASLCVECYKTLLLVRGVPDWAIRLR